MNWENFGGLIGTLGLFEWAKWLLTRKATKRKADTDATRDEFHLVQELLAEIKDKTKLIRELNNARLQDARRIHDLEMQVYDKECNRRVCAFREPSKPFTPCYPDHDMSIFEYFNIKPLKKNEYSN